MEIFRCGATKNSAQEANGNYFPIWPPVKHIYLTLKPNSPGPTCRPIPVRFSCWNWFFYTFR